MDEDREEPQTGIVPESALLHATDLLAKVGTVQGGNEALGVKLLRGMGTLSKRKTPRHISCKWVRGRIHAKGQPLVSTLSAAS